MFIFYLYDHDSIQNLMAHPLRATDADVISSFAKIPFGPNKVKCRTFKCHT